MISVYRVVPDFDNYQHLIPDHAAAAMQYRYDGTTINDAWKPPSVYRGNPQKPRPDIWGCMSFGAVMAVTLMTATELVKFLDESCECLSLECDGEKFLLCNVTCVVDALDKRKSRHAEGLPHWIEEYAIHPRRFEYSLFKIPETAVGEILCVEGLAGPDDEFKATVEKRGMKGLKFKKLWSGG
jgi:hypothetical protein